MYLLTAVFTPAFGAIVDKWGNRCFYLLVSPMLAVIAHAFLGFYGYCDEG